MNKIIIVSMDKNGLIGNKGKLPWHIPEELQFFKKETTGYPIVMGRKTWDSLPKKPLPNRYNIVLTRGHEEMFATHAFVNDWEDAWPLVIKDKVFIIGGAEIYKQAMNIVDKMLVSVVKGEYEGDTYFPQIDESWKKRLQSLNDKFDVYEYEKI